MCNATTKAGSQCKVQVGLVEGLCSKHRPKDASAEEKKPQQEKKQFVIVISPEEEGGIPQVVGPFKTEAAAKNALSDYEGEDKKIVEMMPPKKKQKSNEPKQKCTHVYARGTNKGKQCVKNAISGTSFCGQHKPLLMSDSVGSLPVEEDERAEEDSCNHKFNRGQNKGRLCGKPVVSGTEKCHAHSPKDSVKKRDQQVGKCNATLKKGGTCNKPTIEGTDLCKRHTPKGDAPPASVPDPDSSSVEPATVDVERLKEISKAIDDQGDFLSDFKFEDVKITPGKLLFLNFDFEITEDMTQEKFKHVLKDKYKLAIGKRGAELCFLLKELSEEPTGLFERDCIIESLRLVCSYIGIGVNCLEEVKANVKKFRVDIKTKWEDEEEDSSEVPEPQTIPEKIPETKPLSQATVEQTEKKTPEKPEKDAKDIPECAPETSGPVESAQSPPKVAEVVLTPPGKDDIDMDSFDAELERELENALNEL